MKAIILVAGFGSRLKPLTDNSPKSLLPIGDSTTMKRMVGTIASFGINDFIFVTGYLEEQIKDYVKKTFPEINAVFVRNDSYETTNTGFSLMLAEKFVANDSFVKLDGDVNFDPEIMRRLLATPDDACYLCLDKTDVNDEVIKASLDPNGEITALGKYVPVELAVGESIGIEKIPAKYTELLFQELKNTFKDTSKHQEYYEYVYDLLIKNKQAIFKPVDITGLDWEEMDNLQDYESALKLFA